MSGANENNNKVLIVEDEPAIAEVCKIVLSDRGFEVDIAGDGKAAQAAVGREQYSLLLLDIRLPVMGGGEFHAWLEQEHPQLAKKVIFMTGSVMGNDTKTLLEHSGQPYLMKPFRPEELVSTVEEFLRSLE